MLENRRIRAAGNIEGLATELATMPGIDSTRVLDDTVFAYVRRDGPRLPEILSSSDAARAIALELDEGESLSEHEVHERAWVLVIDGTVELTTASGEHASSMSGMCSNSALIAVLNSRRASVAPTQK